VGDQERDQREQRDQGLGGRQGQGGQQAPGRSPIDDQSKGRGGQRSNPGQDIEHDRGMREGKEGERKPPVAEPSHKLNSPGQIPRSQTGLFYLA
jgi:hypothetical protein